MTSSMEMAIIIAKSIEIIMPKIIFFLLEGLYFLSIIEGAVFDSSSVFIVCVVIFASVIDICSFIYF